MNDSTPEAWTMHPHLNPVEMQQQLIFVLRDSRIVHAGESLKHYVRYGFGQFQSEPPVIAHSMSEMRNYFAPNVGGTVFKRWLNNPHRKTANTLEDARNMIYSTDDAKLAAQFYADRRALPAAVAVPNPPWQQQPAPRWAQPAPALPGNGPTSEG
jgi:hypothetical protein